MSYYLINNWTSRFSCASFTDNQESHSDPTLKQENVVNWKEITIRFFGFGDIDYRNVCLYPYAMDLD